MHRRCCARAARRATAADGSIRDGVPTIPPPSNRPRLKWRLSVTPIQCYKSFMNAWSWLRTILPVLAIVGLIFGPVVASASGAAMMAGPAMSTMADGMPCCPHKQPAAPDCQKDCSLMALCMAKCFAETSVFSALTDRISGNGDLLALASERFPPSHASVPPARPPRS